MFIQGVTSYVLNFLSRCIEFQNALTKTEVPHENFSVNRAAVKGVSLVSRPRKLRLVCMLLKLHNELFLSR